MTIEKITNEQHHSQDGRLSSSTLKILLQSPAHYEHYLNSERVDKPEWLFGRAYHEYCLEQKFTNTVVMPPDVKTRRGKLFDKLVEENPDKDLIKQEEFETIEAMRDVLYRHPVWDDIARTCDLIETSIFGEFEGLKFKIRPDAASSETKTIYDLKTTRDASYDPKRPWSGFAGDVDRFGHDLQAYLYLTVFAQEFGHAEKFVLVAQEKTPPYLVRPYVIRHSHVSQALQSGREKFRKAVENYRLWQGATQNGVHPEGYPNEAIEL